MSDFYLDIDYPYEVIKKENLNDKPDCAIYQLFMRIIAGICGKLLEKDVTEVAGMCKGRRRIVLIVYLANHMKKALTAWNKAVDDEKNSQKI